MENKKLTIELDPNCFAEFEMLAAERGYEVDEYLKVLVEAYVVRYALEPASQSTIH